MTPSSSFFRPLMGIPHAHPDLLSLDRLPQRDLSNMLPEATRQTLRGVKVSGDLELVAARASSVALLATATNPSLLNSVHVSIKDGLLHLHLDPTPQDGPGKDATPSRITIGLFMPSIPAIELAGTSRGTVLDINQAAMELLLRDNAVLRAFGSVDRLDAVVDGPGGIEAENLMANRAILKVIGDGGIRARARSGAMAHIEGAGHILVRGNPPRRNEHIMGTGRVSFR